MFGQYNYMYVKRNLLSEQVKLAAKGGIKRPEHETTCAPSENISQEQQQNRGKHKQKQVQQYRSKHKQNKKRT